MRKRPLIAIVGRPNVGKSTLFNRIVGERVAVVHPLPGMTRDRHYADAEYRARPFTLIDTGGYEDSTDSTLLHQMRMQSIVAIEESDRVLFLTDVREPDDPVDQEIIERLRASHRPFVLAVNKCDSPRAENQAYADFSRFGLDNIYPISAKQGDGVYDMLDDLTDGFEEWDSDEEEQEDPNATTRVAIVGRQNVGKSTLLNQLIGEERVIANPVGGTTRDAIDVEFEAEGHKYIVIDTAGIRRRGKIEYGPEGLSVHSSFRAIDRCHVALLVIDATDGITAQDQHVAGYVLERKKSCIILVNKWDLVQDREKKYSELIGIVRRQFRFMPWAPIMTISALTGQRTQKIWSLIRNCAINFAREFVTRELNIILAKTTSHVSIPTRKGNAVAIKYVTQTGTRPPTLSFFVNDPRLVHFSYRRYLTNQYYSQLGLEGTPLILRFRRKAPPRGWERNTAGAQASADSGPALLDENQAWLAGQYGEDGEAVALELGLHAEDVDPIEDEDDPEEDDE